MFLRIARADRRGYRDDTSSLSLAAGRNVSCRYGADRFRDSEENRPIHWSRIRRIVRVVVRAGAWFYLRPCWRVEISTSLFLSASHLAGHLDSTTAEAARWISPHRVRTHSP